MSGFDYRISVIPAGAITDPRLSARALQVLCLLGRHTNDAGWCSRSQVKMARELSCSRSTVQLALDCLYEAGWVERRANGRGNIPAEAAQHPFAAYSYRVLLDREVIPARVGKPEDVAGDAPPAAVAKGGADISAGGGADPESAGGADISAGGADSDPAPLEGESLKERVSEPDSERETRAREAPSLTAFQARWPTSATDDQTHTAKAWAALSAEDRRAALEGVPPFLEQLKLNKRQHVPAGWRYLEERRWLLLPKREVETGGAPKVIGWSREWWAIVVRRCLRGGQPGFLAAYALEHGAKPCIVPPGEMPGAAELERFQAYPSDGEEMAAWRPWLAARGLRLLPGKTRFWVYLPGPKPPEAGVRTATGPPQAA